jgi:subtilisin-like proprotein convertase family protein
MQFRLYDQEENGSPVGGLISTTVPITDGLFIVNLDFGDVFTGDALWLDVGVRCPGESVFTGFDRQALTASPYALFARSAGALHGNPVTTTAPMEGEVLEWDGDEWAPAAIEHPRLSEVSNGVLSNEFDRSWDIETPVSIPDTGTAVASLVVADNGTLLSVQTTVTIAHPHSQTLQITLKFFPSGEVEPAVELTLFEGEDYVGDCPTLPAPANCDDPDDAYCQVTGFVWPTVDQPASGSFDDFLGLDPTGNWELWVTDSCETYPGAADEGTQYINEFRIDYLLFADDHVTVNGSAHISDSLTISGTLNGGTPWTSANDGHNSGLDADTVDTVHAISFQREYYDGYLAAGNSVSIEIPHYAPFTLQLASGWPDDGGVAFVQGFENDRTVAITFIAYNGNGTSQTGGAECHESSTTTLLQFGVGEFIYQVKCPGEASGAHNLVLTAQAGGVELKYRLIY